VAKLPGIQYLERVAVRDLNTWVCICHKGQDWTGDDGKLRSGGFPGHMFQLTDDKSFRAAYNEAMFWCYKKERDTYLAQAAYLNPGPITKGFTPNADRKYPNIAGCKNLYMDMDVKPGAYATRDEADVAFWGFIDQAQIPEPTIMVGSGTGGFHAYWTLNEIFDQKIFSDLANRLVSAALQFGVVFDTACTVDATRVLRIPGTKNFKRNPAGDLVTLELDTGADIDFQMMKDALAQFKPASTSNSVRVTGASLNDDMTGGGVGKLPPIEVEKVAEFCPLIKDTLEQGGANLKDDPQWHAVGTIAYYCTEPRPTFHRLSEKNPNYNPDEADKKFNDIENQHSQERVGPYKCERIEGTGIPQCAACPYRTENTTPTALPFKHARANSNVASFANPYPNSSDLPREYYRGNDNLIYTTEEKEGGSVEKCVFKYPIFIASGFVEEAVPSHRISFDTTQGNSTRVTKTFDTAIIGDKGMFARSFSAQSLPLSGDTEVVRRFFLAYLSLLRSGVNMVDVPPFGWHVDGEGNRGFAFAGEFTSNKGTTRAKRGDSGMADRYGFAGDRAVWTNLANTIITPDRPDLAMLVASSFAAPLVHLSGQKGFIVGAFGESGVGKSTALTLNQAVWGKPLLDGLDDTDTYVFNKAGQLKHLPLLHDEIRNEQQIATFCKFVFQLTKGTERNRAFRTGQAKPTQTFETLIAYAANVSMVSAVMKKDPQEANALRIFEVPSVEKVSKNKQLTSTVAASVKLLDENYGMIGRDYAAWIGPRQLAIKAALLKFQEDFEKKYNLPQKERFWGAHIATNLLGATIATKQGYCIFPLVELEAYLVAQWRRMSAELASHVSNFSTNEALAAAIGAYISDKAERNMLILDRTSSARKQKAGSIIILNSNEGRFDKQWGTLDVSLSGVPLLLRLAGDALEKWCKDTSRPYAMLCKSMKDRVGATYNTRTIGGGTIKTRAQVKCWDIQITGSILEPIFEQYTEDYTFVP